MTKKPLVSNPNKTIYAMYDWKEIHRTTKKEYNYLFQYEYIKHEFTLND